MLQPHNPQNKSTFSLSNRSAFFQSLQNQEATAAPKNHRRRRRRNDVFASLLTDFGESLVVSHGRLLICHTNRFAVRLLLDSGRRTPLPGIVPWDILTDTHTYIKHCTECGIAWILRLPAGGGRETSLPLLHHLEMFRD